MSAWQCPVCRQSADDDAAMVPCLLNGCATLAHPLCFSCVQQLRQEQKSPFAVFECPFCRKFATHALALEHLLSEQQRSEPRRQEHLKGVRDHAAARLAEASLAWPSLPEEPRLLVGSRIIFEAGAFAFVFSQAAIVALFGLLFGALLGVVTGFSELVGRIGLSGVARYAPLFYVFLFIDARVVFDVALVAGCGLSAAAWEEYMHRLAAAEETEA